MIGTSEGYMPTLKKVEVVSPPIDSHILQKDQSQMFAGSFHSRYATKEYHSQKVPGVTYVPTLYCFANDPLTDQAQEQAGKISSPGDFLTIGASGVGYSLWQQSSEQISRGLIILDKDIMITNIYVPLQIRAARSSDNLAGYWEKMTGLPLHYIESKLGRDLTYDEIRANLNLCETSSLFIDSSGHIKTDSLKKAVDSNPQTYKEIKSLMTPEYVQKFLHAQNDLRTTYQGFMNKLVEQNVEFERVPFEAFLEAFNHSRLMASSYLNQTKNFPFTDPLAYAKWKAAVTYQPITTICADVFNSDHVKIIGEMQKKKGVMIAGSFLSNVEEYTPKGLESGKYLAESFKSLPYDEQALVFRVDLDDDKSSGIISHKVNGSWKEFDHRYSHKVYGADFSK